RGPPDVHFPERQMCDQRVERRLAKTEQALGRERGQHAVDVRFEKTERVFQPARTFGGTGCSRPAMITMTPVAMACRIISRRWPRRGSRRPRAGGRARRREMRAAPSNQHQLGIAHTHVLSPVIAVIDGGRRHGKLPTHGGRMTTWRWIVMLSLLGGCYASAPPPPPPPPTPAYTTVPPPPGPAYAAPPAPAPL